MDVPVLTQAVGAVSLDHVGAGKAEETGDGGRKVEEDTELNSVPAGELTVAQYMVLLDPTDRYGVRLHVRDDEMGLAERDVPAHTLRKHGYARLAVRDVHIHHAAASSRGRATCAKENSSKRKGYRTSDSMCTTRGVSLVFTTAFQHPALRQLAHDLVAECDVSPALLDVTHRIAGEQNKDFALESTTFAEELPTLFEACGLPFRYKVRRQSSGEGMPDIALEVKTDCADSPPLIAAMIKGTQCRGSSGDPWPEIHTHYAAHVLRCNRMWLMSSLPCVLAVLDGHEWAVGCGVVETTVMMERLSNPIQLCVPEDGHHLADVARSFRAWAHAVNNVASALLHALDERQRAIRASSDGHVARENVALAFPHVIVGLQRVNFIQHLARGAYRATWCGQAVVFKATRHNHDEAQKVLAASGAAPRLHASEVVYGRRGVRWKALVMEDLFVQGFRDASSCAQSLTEDDKRAISEQVHLALTSLHEAGFVFFDLRLPNIMVKQEKRGWSVRLIDFEMCGRAGTSLVAKHLNQDLTWPDHRSSRTGSDDGEAAAEGGSDDMAERGAAATAGDRRGKNLKEGHELHVSDDTFMLSRLWDPPASGHHSSTTSSSQVSSFDS